MCFSAEASFTVSTVLLITGVASIKKATVKSQILFASIPFIFSFQQFFEGILWMALKDPVYSQWQWPATYAFLLFAQVVWPVWVPLAFLCIETEAKRRKILSVLLYLGIALSVYLAYCLFTYDVRSEIIGHHIQYELFFPYYLRWYSGLFYFFPTVISAFISSVKRTRMLGVLTLASYIVSTLFFKDYLISVWCFFAAIISAVIVVIVHSLNERNRITELLQK